MILNVRDTWTLSKIEYHYTWLNKLLWYQSRSYYHDFFFVFGFTNNIFFTAKLNFTANYVKICIFSEQIIFKLWAKTTAHSKLKRKNNTLNYFRHTSYTSILMCNSFHVLTSFQNIFLLRVLDFPVFLLPTPVNCECLIEESWAG